jgi:hypothetical protein
LVLSFLLRGNLRVPDVFFFINGHLLDSVKKEGALIGHLLRSGIIQPIFRNPTDRSFRDAAKSVAGIQGVVRDADEVADVLDNMVTGSDSEFAPGYWRGRLGLGYEQNIKHFLHGPHSSLPGYLRGHTTLERVWKTSKRWRTDCVDQALTLAPTCKDGLRYANLLNAVAWSLGVPRETRLSKADQVLRFAEEQGKPLHEREALRYFCQWVREIYQYTQAEDFSARPFFGNVPLRAPLVQVSVVGETFGVGDYRPFEIIDANLTPLDTFFDTGDIVREHSCHFCVPHPDRLRRIPPHDLIAIRKNEGEEYFRSVSMFCGGHYDSDTLFKSAKAYANALFGGTRREMTAIDIFKQSGGGALIKAILAYRSHSYKVAAALGLAEGLWQLARWYRPNTRQKVELRAGIEVGTERTSRRTGEGG